MHLIIRFYLNHHKKIKTLKFFKIFLEPLIRVPKASHTTFFYSYLEIFLVIKRILIIRLIRYSWQNLQINTSICEITFFFASPQVTYPYRSDLCTKKSLSNISCLGPFKHNVVIIEYLD